jgi:DMSO/TMAO reductase YedYZ molybdopterin-dependent catalytic subunit
MSRFTRAFTRHGSAENPERLPPGQYDIGDAWPVLTAEVTPQLSTSSWSFSVEGLVERPTTWTWDEIRALPPSTTTATSTA